MDDDEAVSPRLPAQRTPPLTFAHRGARAHERENTIAAFVLAQRLGATGLESDVWLTADDEPVLDHDGVVRRFGLFRRPITQIARASLPHHIPSLRELYDECGVDYELSLDLKDDASAEAVVAVADDVERATGQPVRSRLWLAHPDLALLTRLRQRWADVRLLNSVWLSSIKEGPERRAAQLAEAGIDAINMHYSDWTGGLTTLFHRFGVECFGWDAQHERVIAELLDMGIDAVYSDHVDRMVEVHSRVYGPPV